ncbi:MAG: helix-turn-helix domain-containing protein [Terracidiphilus sp.]
MRIQPIRTEADHDAAIERIAQLMGAKPGSAASDELEVLATLVDVYESRHFPIDTPDPVKIIQFQMGQQNLTRKDLEPMIGSRARVSEVLAGKRALTLAMIRRLHAGLQIPIDLLVGMEAAARKKVLRRGMQPGTAAFRTRGQVAAKVRGR